MSTRSQIITIENGKPVAVHYHHCDGYINGGVGQELYEAIKVSPMAVSDMMLGWSHQYEDETDDNDPTHVPHHVDIEYLYYVDRDKCAVYAIWNESWWEGGNEQWDYTSEWTQARLRQLTDELVANPDL